MADITPLKEDSDTGPKLEEVAPVTALPLTELPADSAPQPKGYPTQGANNPPPQQQQQQQQYQGGYNDQGYPNQPQQGPSQAFNNQQQGPPQGYNNQQQQGPPQGYNNQQAPPKGYPTQQGPPQGYNTQQQQQQQQAPPQGYNNQQQQQAPSQGYPTQQQQGPPQGYNNQQQQQPPPPSQGYPVQQPLNQGYNNQQQAPPQGYNNQQQAPPQGYNNQQQGPAQGYPVQQQQQYPTQGFNNQQQQQPPPPQQQQAPPPQGYPTQQQQGYNNNPQNYNYQQQQGQGYPSQPQGGYQGQQSSYGPGQIQGPNQGQGQGQPPLPPGYVPPPSTNPSKSQPPVPPGFTDKSAIGFNQPTVAQPLTSAPSMPQWMSRPENTTNCPPGLEYLTMVDQIIIQQQVDALDTFTSFEGQNKYTVLNSLGQQVYIAAEESELCMRQCLGSMRGFVMHMIDNMGQEVMKVTRDLKVGAGCCWFACCKACSLEIVVEAPVGTVIGKVKQRCSVIRPLFDVTNADDQVVFRIQGPILMWAGPCCIGDQNFYVYGPDMSKKVATVSKEFSGLVKEMFTKADNFGISFPMDLDVNMKATLLGSVFLIDFMYYELLKTPAT